MQKCKLCGNEIKNSSLTNSLLKGVGDGLCEQCALNIYTMNNTTEKLVYYKKLDWLNKLLASDTLSDETKLFIEKNVRNDRIFKGVSDCNATHRNNASVFGKKLWSSLIKTVAYILIIVLGIIGGTIGYGVATYSDDRIVFVIIGGVIGVIIGFVLLAFVMLFVEMAKNIATIVNLLSAINNKLDK